MDRAVTFLVFGSKRIKIMASLCPSRLESISARYVGLGSSAAPGKSEDKTTVPITKILTGRVKAGKPRVAEAISELKVSASAEVKVPC